MIGDSACIWQQHEAVVLPHIFIFSWWMILRNTCKFIQSCKVEWIPTSHSAPQCLFGSRGLHCNSLPVNIFREQCLLPGGVGGGWQKNKSHLPSRSRAAGAPVQGWNGVLGYGQGKRTLLRGEMVLSGQVVPSGPWQVAVILNSLFKFTALTFWSKLSFMFLVTDELF